MARRIKIGGSGADADGSVSQEKALSDVEVTGNNRTGGGAILNFFSTSGGDRELTQQGAIEAYHSSPPLYMAVSAIARSVGAVEYGWEDENEPTGFSLKSPNRWHQSAEFFGLCAAYLKLTGEFYAIKKATAQGAELWPIPPHLMDEPETHGGQWRVEGGAVGGLSKTDYNRDELIILKEPSLLDPFMHGRGAGQVAGHDVDIDEAAAEHTASYLENHARPDALVGLDGANKSDIKRFTESMRKKHGGPGNSGKIEAFEAGITVETLMADLDKIGSPELRRQSGKICQRVFNVPPLMVGDVQDANLATAEVEERYYKANVIKPLVLKIVEGINEQFIRMDIGDGHTVITGQIVPANTERRLDYADEHPGAVFVNESRQWIGLDSRDEFEDRTLADVQPTPPSPQQRSHTPQQTRHDHTHNRKKKSCRWSQNSRNPRSTPSSTRSTRRTWMSCATDSQKPCRRRQSGRLTISENGSTTRMTPLKTSLGAACLTTRSKPRSTSGSSGCSTRSKGRPATNSERRSSRGSTRGSIRGMSPARSTNDSRASSGRVPRPSPAPKCSQPQTPAPGRRTARAASSSGARGCPPVTAMCALPTSRSTRPPRKIRSRSTNPSGSRAKPPCTPAISGRHGSPSTAGAQQSPNSPTTRSGAEPSARSCGAGSSSASPTRSARQRRSCGTPSPTSGDASCAGSQTSSMSSWRRSHE